AQIENQLLRALLLLVTNLAGDLLGLAFGKRDRLDIDDTFLDRFICGAGNHDIVAGDSNFLRLGFSRTNDRESNVRALLAGKFFLDGGKRHLMRALALDRLDNVPGFYAGLIRRATGKHGNYRRISEALGDGSSDVGVSFALVGLVELVLIRIQIAGVGIERFQQPMQSSAGDGREIWFLNVFRTNTREHFAVNAELAVSAVVTVRGMNPKSTQEYHENNQERERKDANLELLRH